jgi:succinate dehydrogenase / fumarate reductase cytochrome b subunit
MDWIQKSLTSSLGKKLVMGLTGFFLIMFLIVHLMGNLQLLYNDNGEAFNVYTYFMTHNPLIKTISYGLYFFILLHAVLGLALKRQNYGARPVKYDKAHYPGASFASKQMALLGILIFAFLMLHMGDFWFKMKFTDQLAMMSYDGYDHTFKDLYTPVQVAFNEIWIVVAYLVGVLALALHLWHGFDSISQTFGWRHMKFGGIFKGLGRAYTIIICSGFAMIPVYFLIFR